VMNRPPVVMYFSDFVPAGTPSLINVNSVPPSTSFRT
jgi:hypothetical protein